MNTTLTPKQIRRVLGLPLLKIAAMAGVSEPTCRLYEADPAAVTRQKRDALDPVYAELRRQIETPKSLEATG